MNGFVAWLMSPLSEWHTTGITAKLFSGAVGAGVAYWLTTKKLPTWQIVLYSLLAAYGTSMVVNAARRFSALPAQQILPAILPIATAPLSAGTTLPSMPASESKPEEKTDESGLGDDGIFA